MYLVDKENDIIILFKESNNILDTIFGITSERSASNQRVNIKGNNSEFLELWRARTTLNIIGDFFNQSSLAYASFTNDYSIALVFLEHDIPKLFRLLITAQDFAGLCSIKLLVENVHKARKVERNAAEIENLFWLKMLLGVEIVQINALEESFKPFIISHKHGNNDMQGIYLFYRILTNKLKKLGGNIKDISISFHFEFFTLIIGEGNCCQHVRVHRDRIFIAVFFLAWSRLFLGFAF